MKYRPYVYVYYWYFIFFRLSFMTTAKSVEGAPEETLFESVFLLLTMLCVGSFTQEEKLLTFVGSVY
jgi:hypothetical protein